MKISTILESIEPKIIHADPEDWEASDQAYHIAAVSGIRIARNKELTLIAQIGDDIVGAIWSSFELDGEASKEFNKDIYCYDFDVAVSPKLRSTGLTSAKIGPKLIDAALNHYRSLKSEFGVAYIRVWVVNRKLANYLEQQYGFDPEGGGSWSPDSPFMVYHH